MSQGSQDINQQFIDGGVIPGQLVSQDAVSKTYVDGQNAELNADISSAAASAAAAQGAINTHEASATAHSAAAITYSGAVAASNVRQAIDQTDQRVSTIVAGAGASNTEILDARQPASGAPFTVLRDRLNNTDAQLAETAQEFDKRGVNIEKFIDLVIDDDWSAAIQAAHDSLDSNGGSIFVPPSTYTVKSEILITKNFVEFFGSGKASVIQNIGITDTFHFQNNERCSISNLSIRGNGGAYGVGATNGNAIVQDNSRHNKFTEVYIEYNGGHGIFNKNTNVCTYIDKCYITQNYGDGVNSISTTGHQNGNNLSIVNTAIFNNSGDGVAWSAASLNISGGVLEFNKKAGIHIDCLSANQDAFGVFIAGVYFENNIGGQIKFSSGTSPSRSLQGGEISGNLFLGNHSDSSGETSLIVGYGNSNFSALGAVHIGYNSYLALGPVVVNNIMLDQSAFTTHILMIGSTSLYNISGSAKLSEHNETITLSVLSQTGIPSAAPYITDNFYAQPTKVCYFPIPIQSDAKIVNIKVPIDTTATSYTINLSLMRADPTSSAGLASVGTKTQNVTTSGRTTVSWDFSPYHRVLKGNTYYLKVEITSVVGGAFMVIYDVPVVVN
ncbi:right-handed parallel beta-helix repeat-containing protein [Paenibacillus sonchi]|uniref:right-handed parallel beta-helix repeat-containing protein n=1 Tax=Paenibacillus sonchi TaxID=373687 RepID=UPI001E4334E1|nr:right-handed parallel beta-helix repeat-containing protein [Paenibacillus sonchi]MCE3202472.1 right-handed parallel beta-helix repeat-containing protein [Paenibacillus sonchi]